MRNVLLSLVVIVLTSCTSSQFLTVEVPAGPDSKKAYGQVEPSIAIHPKDNNIIAAGTVLDDYYYSMDGGKTWVSTTIKSSNGVYGDPVLLFDSLGVIYYFHLASINRLDHLDRIVCQKSDSVNGKFNDGSFPAPVKGKVQDKHWIEYHAPSNTFYMTWTQFDKYGSKATEDSSYIMYASSTDFGKTWSSPVQIAHEKGDCVDGDETVEGAIPIMTEDGHLIVVWTGPSGLNMQKSTDGGKTWLKEDKKLFDQPGGWTYDIPGFNRANGLPNLRYNPINKSLYLLWSDQRNGENNTDIWMSISEDDGDSWKAPFRVNQNQDTSHQFFACMAIDPSDGGIYVAYYDRRNLKGDETNVYLSYSKDFGRTFKDTPVKEGKFVPNEKVFFGDYLGIDARNGKLVLMYPEMNLRKISLYFTSIETKNLK